MLVSKVSSSDRNQGRKQQGAILPLFAIGLVLFLGMAGLAIDSSHSFVNVTRLQNALDAAALSAGRTLNKFEGDEALATVHGTTTFTKHLGGASEMDNSLNLSFTYSEKLIPFTSTANPSRFVRASVTNHTIRVWLARVLPGVGATTTIGTTAVSGPIPVGTGTGDVCDIAPLIVCGDPLETTPDDGELFGLPYGGGELYCLKASSSTGGNGNGGGNSGPPGACAVPVNDIGPGNFQLIQLDCGAGGDCVRDNLAGEYAGCINSTDPVLTKPGNTVGPTAQGFNTRFGQYQGPVNSSDHPPDYYVNANLTYAQYANKYKLGDAADHSIATPTAGRRVMSVPIGDCSPTINGQGSIDVLAFGCYFMREPTVNNGQDNWIIGELIDQCEASGEVDYKPDVSDEFKTNWKIILYNDPGNLAS